MDALAILSIIAGGAGSLITIITFCTLVFKPLRERFIKWVRKITNHEEIDKEINSVNDKIDKLTGLVEKTVEQNAMLQNEMAKQSNALQASLRNSILNLYYKCTERGSITMFEKQNLTMLYDNYKNLNGNSFISDCVQELKTLRVKD